MSLQVLERELAPALDWDVELEVSWTATTARVWGRGPGGNSISMGRMFSIPETAIAPQSARVIRRADLGRDGTIAELVAEVRRVVRLRAERLRAADMLEQTLAGARVTRRVIVPDLPDDEQQALLRAAEHLRWSEDGISGELGRLHGALEGWVPLPHVTYELAFGYGGERSRFVSYTGRYEIGDRLPPTKRDECWEVVDVEAPRGDSADGRLIVEPCREDR